MTGANGRPGGVIYAWRMKTSFPGAYAALIAGLWGIGTGCQGAISELKRQRVIESLEKVCAD